MEENKIENRDRLERIFLEYFKLFEMPKGARPERILVYRACKSGLCDKVSFTPTFEEKGCRHGADEMVSGMQRFTKPLGPVAGIIKKHSGDI